MKLYKVEKISLNNVDSTFAKAWVELLSEAPQASFFSQLHYLTVLQNVFNRKIELWYIMNGDKMRAGGVLFIHPVFKKAITHLYYSPYTGVFIRELPEEHHSKKMIRRNQIYNSFKLFIEKNYSYSHFIFTPDTLDIRELSLSKNWNVKLKYTFNIDISNIDNTLKNIQRGERRRIKNFELEGQEVYTFKADEFAKLIFSSYERHKMLPPLSFKQLKTWLRELQFLRGINFFGITNSNDELQSGLLWA
ncbi:MAG: hypothetical protein KAR38_12570, partial [Calditrichia bacterium]|nr:hypothetical protein [Calditrichia bacterium]